MVILDYSNVSAKVKGQHDTKGQMVLTIYHPLKRDYL